VFKTLKKLQWLDYVLLVLVIGFFAYIWWQIEGNLNYKWRWHLIPNYILRYHTVREEWFANVILQGLAATCSHQHLCQRVGGDFGDYTGSGALFEEPDRAHVGAHVFRSAAQYSAVGGDFHFLFLLVGTIDPSPQH
jgi:hypothetical protein